MNPYTGMEEDVHCLDEAGRRLKHVGFFLLVLFGPPSLFLFVGTLIAAALGQPVARRAVIVFPVLAFVVFGTGVGYRILARHVRRGRRWAAIVSLCIAASVSFLGLLDFWPAMVGEWIVIARIVVVVINLTVVKFLLRSVGPAQRIDLWMNSILEPDSLQKGS
jgi:hypothetical protein